MLAIYLAALIVGAGTIAAQLLMAGHGGADASHDVTADGHDLDHASSGFLPIFLSLRFWTFGLMAFGLVGAALQLLGLLASIVIPVVAAGMGLLCGGFASWSFRALARAATQSGAEAADAVGHVGKVLVPCAKGARGKVRVELKGQSIDYLATTDDEGLEPGAQVLVEEMRDGTAHVSRAPQELDAGSRDEEA